MTLLAPLLALTLSQAPSGIGTPEKFCGAQKTGKERPGRVAWGQMAGDPEFSCLSEAEVGPPTEDTRLSNVIGMMATSPVRGTVREVELTIRLFNKEDGARAYKQFPDAVRLFFTNAGLEVPPKLVESVKAKKPMQAQMSYGMVKFSKETANVECWKVQITAK